jgi:hypothetical protein
MIVCNYEDRMSEGSGVELLVLSLQRHCPGLDIDLTFPGIDGNIARALSARPGVRLRVQRTWPDRGYNAKPLKLIELLDEGHDEVVWIDSDIIATDDVRRLFAGVSSDTLIVSQEVYWGQHQGGVHRTKSWGLAVGRSLVCTANSSVIRVTPAHRELLAAWQELLRQPRYLQAQDLPYYQRPIHLLSDQEVLTALLGSKQFAHVPLKFLKRGSEVVQHFGPGGYTVKERLENVFRGRRPPLIHTQGPKPWTHKTAPLFKNFRAWYTSLALELSPYASIAAEFRDELVSSTTWMERKSLLGAICKALTLNNIHLRGLPQATFDEMIRWCRRAAGISRYEIRSDPQSHTAGTESFAQLQS